MRYLPLIIIFIFPLFYFAQGDNYILFSATGDTLITRTSCYCKSVDTLTTYFNILDNVAGNLRLVSVFEIREPGKNSFPCADFTLVSKDTIDKYGLYIEGKLGTFPKRFKIKSKILQVDTATTDKGKFIYYKQIRHTFKIGLKSFYTATVWNVAENKGDRIEIPKVHRVYGSREINKYHFVVILVDARVDKQTGKVTTTYAHTRIIN